MSECRDRILLPCEAGAALLPLQVSKPRLTEAEQPKATRAWDTAWRHP